ncbi:unnamed protein product [Amoebophrya sp. A25]|nr:unnamed protein product [Amoebophrya sp. A25]|eukprot:GSA25T00015439001.1
MTTYQEWTIRNNMSSCASFSPTSCSGPSWRLSGCSKIWSNVGMQLASWCTRRRIRRNRHSRSTAMGKGAQEHQGRTVGPWFLLSAFVGVITRMKRSSRSALAAAWLLLTSGATISTAWKFAIDPVKRASMNEMFYSLPFPPPCNGSEPEDVFQPHCVPGLSKWVHEYAPCEYFGFQYSMEWFFAHVFDENKQFLAQSADDAYFVFFPHCVSRVYFVFKLDLGMEHWAAIAKAEADYLVPLLRWTHLHPLHKKFGGKNFWTVFSMDLGRQDFQRSAPYLQEWSVGQLAGHPEWIHGHFWTGKEQPTFTNTHSSSCWKVDTEHVVAANEIFSERIQYWYDTVISIPTRFSKSTASLRADDRDIELFFAGSPNSCARRTAIEELNKIGTDEGYRKELQGLAQAFSSSTSSSGSEGARKGKGKQGKSTSRSTSSSTKSASGTSTRSSTAPVPVEFDQSKYVVLNFTASSEEYEQLMYRSKYCLVMCGSSHTNNVRMIDVMVHGCIPVIVSDDFQPPLSGVVPWEKFAIFLPTYKIREIPAILASIPEEKRLEMHRYLVGSGRTSLDETSAADIFDWQSGIFFIAFFFDVRRKLGKRIGLFDDNNVLGAAEGSRSLFDHGAKANKMLVSPKHVSSLGRELFLQSGSEDAVPNWYAGDGEKEGFGNQQWEWLSTSSSMVEGSAMVEEGTDTDAAAQVQVVEDDEQAKIAEPDDGLQSEGLIPAEGSATPTEGQTEEAELLQQEQRELQALITPPTASEKARMSMTEHRMMAERRVKTFRSLGLMRWYEYLDSYCEEGVCANGRERLDTSFATANLGCADAETLLPTLSYIYDLLKRRFELASSSIGDKEIAILPGLWVDGGSNVGKSSLAWFSTIGRMPQHIYAKSLKSVKDCIVCPVHYAADIAVLSVEPNPRNFEKLLKQPYVQEHELFAWYGIEAGLGEKEGIQMMATNPEFAVDEIGSLLFDDATDIRTARDQVHVVTLETAIQHAVFHFSYHRGGWTSRRGRNHQRRGGVPSWDDQEFLDRVLEGVESGNKQDGTQTTNAETTATSTTKTSEEADVEEDQLLQESEGPPSGPYGMSFPQERPVFMLKLDIEGYEPRVIRQSRSLFEQKQIKFLVLEYSQNAWAEGLKRTIKFLDSVGYFCFLITRMELFPISFDFWSGDYENPIWSNVFCGIVGDSDLDLFVEMYHRAPQPIDVVPGGPRMRGARQVDGKEDEQPVGVASRENGGQEQEPVVDDAVLEDADLGGEVSSFETRASTRDLVSQESDGWTAHRNRYLLGHTELTTAANLFSLKRAKAICGRLDARLCGGVTCIRSDFTTEDMVVKEDKKKKEDMPLSSFKDQLVCTLRVGQEGPLGPSPTREITFMRPASVAKPGTVILPHGTGSSANGGVIAEDEHPFLQWRRRKSLFD